MAKAFVDRTIPCPKCGKEDFRDSTFRASVLDQRESGAQTWRDELKKLLDAGSQT